MSGFKGVESDYPQFNNPKNDFDNQNPYITYLTHPNGMYLYQPMMYENQQIPSPTMYAPYVLMFIPQPQDYSQIQPIHNAIGYPPFYRTPEGNQEMKLIQPLYPLLPKNLNLYNTPGLITMNPNQMMAIDSRFSQPEEPIGYDCIPQHNYYGIRNEIYPLEPLTSIYRERKASSDHVSCTLSCISDNIESITEAQIHNLPGQILSSKPHNDSLVYDPSDMNESLSTSTTASTNFVKHSSISSPRTNNYGSKAHNCNIEKHNHDFSDANTSYKHKHPKVYPKIMDGNGKDQYKTEETKNIGFVHKENNHEGISFGTNFHAKGTCKPCRFEWTRGCHVGIDCRFCHHESHSDGCKRITPTESALDRNLHLRTHIINNLSKSAKQWKAKLNVEN